MEENENRNEAGEQYCKGDELDREKCREYYEKNKDNPLHKRLLAKKFGMFIHFNSASFQFHDFYENDWCDGIIDNSNPEYKWFDPNDFNPGTIDFEQWAAVAKSAGCTFGVLTAKHHEGFCLWDTKTTPHNITNSPYKKDVLKDYFETFRKAGVEPCLYYSMLDLNHNITERPVNAAQKRLVFDQLTELLTKYGEFSMLVIDGWNSLWGGPRYTDLPYEELDAHIKSLQQNMLILNHSCENNFDHSDIVFFENAAGQNVPDWFMGPGAGGNILTGNWFAKDRDNEVNLKSVDWAVQKVRDMNSHNVVFLLNASPSINGRINDNMARRFAEIGEALGK